MVKSNKNILKPYESEQNAMLKKIAREPKPPESEQSAMLKKIARRQEKRKRVIKPTKEVIAGLEKIIRLCESRVPISESKSQDISPPQLVKLRKKRNKIKRVRKPDSRLDRILHLNSSKASISETQNQDKSSPKLEKPVNRRSTIKLAMSGAITIIGLIVGWIWLNNSTVMVLGIITLACCSGGIYLLRRYWGQVRDSGTIIVDKTPVPKAQVNNMSLYPDRCVFEDIVKPEGQPWKCINDGKNYFIHIWNEEEKRLKAFALPDQQYYDPTVFAQRVLELPAHRRIFRRKQSLFQKMSPFILILVIIIEWIVIVSTTGTG